MSENEKATKSVKKTETKAEPEKPQAPKSAYAVVGKGDRDRVLASARNGSGKSLSVHHIQRRLVEWGHGRDVYRDRDGFWREGTSAAFSAFAKSQGLSDAEHVEILRALFENDGNVEIVE